MPAILAELLPYDPVAAAVVTLRATTDDDPRICSGLNGQSWAPVLMKAGSFGLDAFDASFPGIAASPTARIELDLSAFPEAARYSWGDRAVTLWVGDPGAAWPWPQLFRGLVAVAESRDGRIRLQLRVDDAWLDRPVLSTYAGTGGLEGPAALKGAPKPLALGAPKYVPPVLIDAVNNVWQFHGYGPARAVVAALDRLVRYPAPTGDFPTLAALLAAAIPPGQFATCLAQGLVRFGAPPAGPLTLIVEGDNGTAAGWVRRAGALITRIAALAGAAGAQLDAANLAALDAAAPYDLSLYVTAQTTARALIAQVAASVNGLARIGLDGELEVILPQIGTPALTLAADGSAEPQVTSFEMLAAGAPWWRTQMAGDICWRPHGDGEFFDPNAAVWSAITGAGKPEDNADVTANAVPTLSVAAATTINADFAGAVLSGQLPRAIQATRKRGDADVSASTSWSLAAQGCTATIGSAGLVEITACSASGWIDVVSLRDSVTLSARITVNRVLGTPPSGGGSGAATASDSTIANVTSASYGTVHGGPLVVRAGAAGQVALTAPLSFSTATAGGAGTFGLRGKWQWRPVGGTWADVAAEISEQAVDEVYDEGGGAFYSLGSGYIEVSQTKTGLTNGTDYEFQLLLRNPSGTRTRFIFDGTATAVAS